MAVPAEITTLPQWCAYKLEMVNGRRTKVPYEISTGARASSTNPSTWTSFSAAQAAYQDIGGYDGICFMLSEAAGIVFIDLDGCIKEDGSIESWASEIVERFKSYTEKSQSGKGLHILIKGIKPGDKCRTTKYPHGVEIYNKARQCCTTGNTLDGYETIEARQDELDKLYVEIFGKEEPKTAPKSTDGGGSALSDAFVIAMASSSKNGEAFESLWSGSTLGYGGDKSAADQALMNMLAYWTGKDPAQMERLFSESNRGKRAKWTDRPDYRERTIKKAIADTAKVYEPSRTRQILAAGEAGRKSNLPELDISDLCVMEIKKTKDGEVITWNFSPDKASESLTKKFNIITTKNNEIWVYEGGIYSTSKWEAISDLVKNITGDRFPTKQIKELEYAVAAKTRSKNEFDPNPAMFGVLNGVLNGKTGEFREYIPEDLITDQSPVIYDPEAKCPEIIRFIEELTPNYDDRITLLDFIASGAYRKALAYIGFLIGRGSSGSTKFIELIQAFYGAKTTDAIPLNELAEGRFALSSLKNIRYSFGQEVDAVKQTGTARIKEISGGDWISSDVKNVQDRARFRGWTKLIFKGNSMPRFTDNSWGFKRRFVGIPLPYRFVPTVDPNEPDQKLEDPEIMDKITTPAELSGLLNLVALRLPWIIKNRRIYRRPGQYDAYKRQVDSVSTFLEEFCEYSDAASIRIPVRKLYAYFEQWCGLINGNTVERRQFGSYVKRYCQNRPGLETKIEGKTETVYPGLMFSENKCNEEISRLQSLLKPDLNRINTGSIPDIQSNILISNTGYTGLKSISNPIEDCTAEELWDEISSIYGLKPQIDPVNPVSLSSDTDQRKIDPVRSGKQSGTLSCDTANPVNDNSPPAPLLVESSDDQPTLGKIDRETPSPALVVVRFLQDKETDIDGKLRKFSKEDVASIPAGRVEEWAKGGVVEVVQ